MTVCPAPPRCPNGRSGSARGARCRAGIRGRIAPRRTGEVSAGDGRDVVLFADTFTTWFEPDNARAAVAVLEAAGYRVHAPQPPARRPLCCGRTFLAAGLVEQARSEARATLAALGPFVEHGVPVVGLEPSCLLTMRDEFTALLPGPATAALAEQALLFEEFLWREQAAGRLRLPLRADGRRRALVHGHCHQKAFGAMEAMTGCLGMVPELEVEVIESSCCGMAGAFGYEAEHHAISLRMAELSLLPAVRAAAPDTLIVANGTSCRHQIHDGAGREAVHAARRAGGGAAWQPDGSCQRVSRGPRRHAQHSGPDVLLRSSAAPGGEPTPWRHLRSRWRAASVARRRHRRPRPRFGLRLPCRTRHGTAMAPTSPLVPRPSRAG